MVTKCAMQGPHPKINLLSAQPATPISLQQTNTSDMLDLAVDYIKELQEQVKVINESRANCTCSATKHQQYSG
jgi:hypothetical protein